MISQNILFEYDGVTASKELENFTVDHLTKLFKRYDFVLRADVFFKTEKTTSRDTGMKCAIRLSAPGPRLFAETSHNTFHTSAVDTIDELEKQLRKRKETMKNY